MSDKLIAVLRDLEDEVSLAAADEIESLRYKLSASEAALRGAEAHIALLKATVSKLSDAEARAEKAVAALAALLRRDERNTCQHEETHRGGAIWEICDSCGAKWADDMGGRPSWTDPPEWIDARACLKEQE